MDPISNMLIMLKNASLAKKSSISFPYSKIKNAIIACLQKEGYVGQITKKSKKGFPVLEVELLYVEDIPKINEVKRVSKQSKRVYSKMKDLHGVRGGSGVLVLSTPKGILSGKDARREQVGGEVLFKMW